MIVDPVLVAAEAVARVQNRRVLVGDPRQFIEPAACERAEAVEMWLQPAKIIRLQIEPEQIAQAAIDRVEILSGAIRRECCAVIEIPAPCRAASGLAERAWLTSCGDRAQPYDTGAVNIAF